MNPDTNYSYPKLKKIDALFTDVQNFDKVAIIACQHLLEPQKIMLEHVIARGVLPENIFILGKAYSSNNSIVSELSEMGILVAQPSYDPTASFDVQHAQNCDLVFSDALRKVSGFERIIILDDGGVLLSRALQEHNTARFIGIEQTSSGFRKLENQDVTFPIFNVARSEIKLEQETPFIIDVGLPRIMEALSSYKIESPRFLIVGLGPIGLELKNRLEKIFPVIAYDKNDGEQNIVEMVLENNINIVIGATGSQVISHDGIFELNKRLDNNILLISISSSDREFEVWKLRGLFKYHQIHDDITFEKITILNGGFPITFKGNRLEAMPEWIENTISLLYAGVLLGISSSDLEKGILSIPDIINDNLRI
jgi:S-adenosylhomocysteine hydrolase